MLLSTRWEDFMKAQILFAAVLCCAALTPAANGHPGGLNKDGCHNDRKNGGYHCHGTPTPRPAPAQPQPSQPRALTSPSAAFANCSAARAAGAAPVRRGEPGYGPHLDRDNDGIGCE